jgi:hypothetical protein
MKAVVCRVPTAPACILGSGTLQEPPSLRTATPGNWGCPGGFGRVKLGQERERAAGKPGAGLG